MTHRAGAIAVHPQFGEGDKELPLIDICERFVPCLSFMVLKAGPRTGFDGKIASGSNTYL